MTPFKIFKIKPEERVQAVVMLAVIVVFNALFIYRMHDLFMQEGFGPYWKVFERELHLSGYDPLTYLGVSNWDVVYNVYRHPLLAFLIWPPPCPPPWASRSRPSSASTLYSISWLSPSYSLRSILTYLHIEYIVR